MHRCVYVWMLFGYIDHIHMWYLQTTVRKSLGHIFANVRSYITMIYCLGLCIDVCPSMDVPRHIDHTHRWAEVYERTFVTVQHLFAAQKLTKLWADVYECPFVNVGQGLQTPVRKCAPMFTNARS
jgi:hypothetical protein